MWERKQQCAGGRCSVPRCYDALETKPKRSAVVAMRSWLSCLVIYPNAATSFFVGLQGYRRMGFFFTLPSLKITITADEYSILHSFQENWGNTSQHKAEPCVCNTHTRA